MQPYSLIAPASTPQLKVIVAEPDNATRTHLRRALNKDHSIKKVIECSNGQKALAAIDQHQPHILFIETHLPDMSGFDVLERNPQIPSVIFLSSFEGSAVRAFDMNAVDFLLKPFLDKRLTKAIRRAKWIATIAT